MLFSVEQCGIFSFRLVWEYGRALGKSRLKTLTGKLLFFPGAWVFYMGVTFTLGMFLTLGEPLSDDEELGMLLMVPLNVVLLLWGSSWCGLCRLPAALAGLFRLRHMEQRTCFYSNRVEDSQAMLRTEYPYDVVADVFESKKTFFVRLNNRQFLILQKDCFTIGEPGAFRRLMDEKCGKPVQKL